jgi:hypothetical protein
VPSPVEPVSVFLSGSLLAAALGRLGAKIAANAVEEIDDAGRIGAEIPNGLIGGVRETRGEQTLLHQHRPA